MKKTAIAMLVWIVIVCCRAFAATPIVWVASSSLDRVGPTDAPGVRTNAVIHAARGEYESFQVAIQAPQGGLTNVNFSVSKLVGRRGAAISRANLILYREEWYITVKRHSPTYNGPTDLPITSVNAFSDALVPFLDPATGKPPVEAKIRAVPFHLVARHNAVIWVDVFVPRGTAAGQYRGTLRDGVEDYEYLQLLKNCGQAAFALAEAQRVGPDWTHWTRDESLLESVREQLGSQIAASNCAP